jgi:tetratricopeptide (TPR) repeat protein
VSRRAPLSFAVALVLAGCATAAPASGPPPPGAPTGTSRAPAASTPRETLAAEYRARAAELERAGELRPALHQYGIALTVKPDDAAAREGRDRLAARIEGLTAERVRLARGALARDDHLLARHHFLAALALDPRNTAAFEALRSEVKDVRFVTHTVRAGETLGAIALRYYGDRSRSEVIWELNQLPPSPRLAPGSTLRIPQIPGVPFLAAAPAGGPTAAPAPPGIEVARPAPGAVPAPAPTPVPPAAPPPDDVPKLDPLYTEARDAFEKRELTVALADVDRLLASNPRHPEGLDLKKAILYEHGKAQLEASNYAASYEALTQLARLAPDYQDGAALLRQARARLVQHHYAEGLRLYRNEKLEDAIAQWRTVLQLDPRHPNAQRNIEQAERILKTLEQRQKR